jgi:methionyl-tRNA formyltransferase
MKKINRVLFIGSKQLGLNCLQAMVHQDKASFVGVMTLDDRADGRNTFDELNSFCNEQNLPIYVAKNRSDSEKIIQELKPDICIVIGWYWLLSKEMLESVPHGMIGIHNSLLPKYRGGAPLIWSIINGEKEVGFSMFSFTEGMDEGDIWFQHAIALQQQDTVQSILTQIEKAAVELLEQNYTKILSGELTAKPQNHAEATYCAQRKPEDGRIDWTKDASYIFNCIRAQSAPYPGAFTVFEQNKLTIQKAELMPEIFYGTPGQVAKISGEGVVVVCGNDRAIRLLEVEYNGQLVPAQSIIKTFQTRFHFQDKIKEEL